MNESPPASQVHISVVKLVGKLSPSGCISFISCALMVENISRITFLAKYLCDGTAYNGQALLKSTGIVYNGKELRVYCYHFCYSACYFLVLWVAIIPLILAFLHLSQCKLTCISFCHFSLYSLAFLSAFSCYLILMVQT